MSQFPKIFIVVLNYNGRDCLNDCLRSLFKVSYPNFEVVVVDNNSTDASLSAAKQSFSRVHYIRNEENLGFSAGNNVGIKFSLDRGADYVLLLNNDTLVAENFLGVLVAEMEKNEIGVGSPLIWEKNKQKVWFSGGKIDWLRMKSKHARDEKKELYFGSDFISGCAMLVRKDVFSKIGLLDEDFFLYWEDADFSVRANRAGFKLAVIPESQIIHLENSEKTSTNKLYWLVISGLIFFKKNAFGWRKFWIFFYKKLRRIKNYRDVRAGKDSNAEVVQKAYKDFKYAKF
jgi:hypothetical protein